MRKTKTLLLCLILGVIFFSGCNAVENGSTSGTKLYVISITGNDLEGNPGSQVIYSDVITGGSVINTTGIVEVDAILLDPGATPTSYQDVIIDQVDITYSRADGLSVEGKDIPRSFSVKTSQMVRVSETSTSFAVELVRHNAKLEAPLADLVNYGGATILKLEANLTIHSKDTAGHRLAPVKASVSIECANFADPNSGTDTGS